MTGLVFCSIQRADRFDANGRFRRDVACGHIRKPSSNRMEEHVFAGTAMGLNVIASLGIWKRWRPWASGSTADTTTQEPSHRADRSPSLATLPRTTSVTLSSLWRARWVYQRSFRCFLGHAAGQREHRAG